MGIALNENRCKMSANVYQSNQKFFCNRLNVHFHILQFQNYVKKQYQIQIQDYSNLTHQICCSQYEYNIYLALQQLTVYNLYLL